MALSIRADAQKERPKVRLVRAAVKTAPHLAPKAGAGASNGSQFRRLGIIPHWNVPPPFPNRRLALMRLGVEAYKQACKEYYEKIGEQGVRHAQEIHARWVIKRCISDFETCMRHFQRHWKERGIRRERNGRRFWDYSSNPNPNAGKLFTPEEMYESSRMLLDIEAVMRRWQVRTDLRPAVAEELKAQLRKLWELKLP